MAESGKTSLAVAHYNEDLAWLRAAATLDGVHIYIYAKGPTTPAVVDASCCHLTNIGREAHTYLYHIIKHYDAIASSPTGVTVFMQGRVRDHLQWYGHVTETELIRGLVQQAHTQGCSAGYARAWDAGDYSAHGHLRIPTCSPNPKNLTFRDWFETHLGQAFPPLSELVWWVGALFAVRHDRIARHPVSLYQNLIKELDSPDPEAGHFFERSWYYIFR